VPFTVTFPASGSPASVDQLASWLTARGEAFVAEAGDVLALRALPVRFLAGPGRVALEARIDVKPDVPLSRMVDVLFDVSVRSGTDVNLGGHGAISRADLWMRLADEQDRMRIAAALARAREHGQHEDIHHRLWAIVASLRADRDDRWDAKEERIVELEESGAVVPVPSTGLHCLTWRWLSEAYPGLAEAGHSLH